MSTRELIRCNTNLSDTCWNTALSPDSHPVLDFVGLFWALLGLDAICPYMLQPWYRGIRDWQTWSRLARLGKIPDQESSVKTGWSPILHHDLLLEPSDHRDRNYQHPQEIFSAQTYPYMIHVLLHRLFCDSVFNLDFPPPVLPHLLHQCQLICWEESNDKHDMSHR